MNIEYRDAFLVRRFGDGHWLASDYCEDYWTVDREQAQLFHSQGSAVAEVFVVGSVCNFKDHEVVNARAGHILPPYAAAPVRVTKFFLPGEEPGFVDWLVTEKSEALRQGFEIAREHVTVYHDGGVRWTAAQLRLCSTFMALRKVPA